MYYILLFFCVLQKIGNVKSDGDSSVLSVKGTFQLTDVREENVYIHRHSISLGFHALVLFSVPF